MKHYFLALITLAFTFFKANSQARPDHIVMVILENKPYEEMVGNPNLPYINSLVNHPNAAVMTKSYALTRPSQPNYFMLFSGSDEGVHHNFVPANTPYTTPNVAASLRSHGYSFCGYAEDLPFVGSLDSVSGHYVRKHNPWVNWQGTGLNNIPDSCNRPFTHFPKTYSQLPTLSIVVPNQMNDMHSGPTTVADAWLRDSLGAYVNWCLNNNSLFILTFDEDNNSGLFNNHILTLFLGSNTIGGFRNQHVTHYNVLRTIEEMYGLPYSGHSADSSAIPGIWTTVLPISMTRFEGFPEGKSVKLNWENSVNAGIKEYEIQRSTNGGGAYTTIGKINADKTVYTFVDNTPVNGTNMYRLKIIKQNNSSNFSKVITVNTRILPSNYFTVSPNPFKDAVTIQTKANAITNIEVEVIDGAGNIVKKSLQQISHLKPVKLTLNDLSTGSYFLRISSEGKTTVKKIQKAAW